MTSESSWTSTAKLDDLAAAAEKATPGPGHVDENYDVEHCGRCRFEFYLDPTTVLRLVAVARAAKFLMAMHEQMGPQFIPHDELDLRAALEEVR